MAGKGQQNDQSQSSKKNRSYQQVVQLQGIGDGVKALNKTLGQGKMLVGIADAIKKQPEITVSSKGRLKYRNHVGDKLKETVKGKIRGKVGGFVQGLVTSELEKLTVDRIKETKKRVVQLAALYRQLKYLGLTIVDVTGFSGTDYWHAQYNEVIAAYIEYVIEHNSEQVRREAQEARALAKQINTNLKIVDEIAGKLLQTAKILTRDVALELAAWNIKGLTQDTCVLLAKTAVGLVTLTSEMLKLKQDGPHAARRITFQATVYEFAIKTEQVQHQKHLKHLAEYVKAKPNSIPPTAGKGYAGALGWWLGKGGREAAQIEKKTKSSPSKPKK